MSSPRALVDFILAREALRRNKEAGLPEADWTDDEVLREFRFCNVRREDDRVTRWVAKHWREPHRGEPDLWFAMCVARFVNWPPTLHALGYPVPWEPENFLRIMRHLKHQPGRKVYTGAYMVRADRESADKAEYQAKILFQPLWDARERLRPFPGDTLNSWHMLLGQFHGLGSFMAAQIVADMKYDDCLFSAEDWRTFAASGPGSRRGLNRVLGRPQSCTWTEEDWRMELRRLQDRVGPILEDGDMMPLHAQDLQNCLCEFDKYQRCLLGEGQPRARYRSHSDDYSI